MKANAREAFERERRILQDNTDTARNDLERIRVKLSEVKQNNMALLQEKRDIQTSLDARIAQLTGQLNLKEFEYTRSTLLCQEQEANLTRANLQVEQFCKKFEVTKEEYNTLRNDTERKITELETTLLHRDEKLTTYEALEKDLDDALVAYGETGKESTPDFMSTYTMTPTVTQRRMKQTVQLSRKLIQVQRSHEETARHLDAEK